MVELWGGMWGAIAARRPARINLGGLHVQVLTIADKYANHSKKTTKRNQKRHKKQKKGEAPLDSTWGSITQMVRIFG